MSILRWVAALVPTAAVIGWNLYEAVGKEYFVAVWNQLLKRMMLP